ncbi:hypothetical protein D9M73_246440 [compost metagenome]
MPKSSMAKLTPSFFRRRILLMVSSRFWITIPSVISSLSIEQGRPWLARLLSTRSTKSF